MCDPVCKNPQQFSILYIFPPLYTPSPVPWDCGTLIYTTVLQCTPSVLLSITTWINLRQWWVLLPFWFRLWLVYGYMDDTIQSIPNTSPAFLKSALAVIIFPTLAKAQIIDPLSWILSVLCPSLSSPFTICCKWNIFASRQFKKSRRFGYQKKQKIIC